MLLGQEAEALLGDIANETFWNQLKVCVSVPIGCRWQQSCIAIWISRLSARIGGTRRTPINGLFNRLRRAVSDAARSENKQVQLKLVGEETGIERAIGRWSRYCTSSATRATEWNLLSYAYKRTQEQGTITLQAKSGPDLLVIEVYDDGRGLDYEAIRRAAFNEA